jgi:hypothetical protein
MKIKINNNLFDVKTVLNKVQEFSPDIKLLRERGSINYGVNLPYLVSFIFSLY